MPKTISFSLDKKEIDNALRELRAYRKDILRKAEQLQDEIAKALADETHTNYLGATMDVLVHPEFHGEVPKDVSVSVTKSGGVSVVIASGKDAIFLEFGAGVTMNPGGATHPLGSKFGYTIGGYGKGLGKNPAWYFRRDGTHYQTYGTPASAGMYNALLKVESEVLTMARRVFAS